MKETWFKEMAMYQIWPRSFCDGNNDGIGDLKGVLGKLDYIKSLGMDAIWFSPLYASPQNDYGYDIADYRNIAPEYGTMEDFKAVLDGAHKLDMKVVMDLVINHTSDQHEWFKKSVRKEGKYADYYIWRKGKGKDGKKYPNNWMSTFPGPAWKWNQERGEYYLHLYAVEQPDLNHDNPDVREEVKNVMRFWLDMGVDGFREDVITQISKKEGLPNGFPLPAARGMEHYNDGPNIHKYLTEYRQVMKEYDCFAVGEAPMMTPKKSLNYVTEGDKQELDMLIGFQHMTADCILISWLKTKFSLVKLKKIYNNWQTTLYGKGWNANYLENHDQPRIISRYGDTQNRVMSGKALAVMYAFLSGTMFVYQGQEIGMTNTKFDGWNDFKDISTFCTRDLMKGLGFKDKRVLNLARYAARDNARTPVQWTAGKNAGFSQCEPWFAVNPNYTEINVEDAEKDKESLLNFYRKIIALRKKYKEEAVYGEFKLRLKNDRSLFVYDKFSANGKLTVMINLSKKTVSAKKTKKFITDTSKLILSNSGAGIKEVIKPYEAFVYYTEQ